MKIVATSGCFDVLHAGHVKLFEEMRKIAGPDGLVVVLMNTDEYLKRTKGPSRPVQVLEHRMMIVGACRFVDVVLPFKQNDPCYMIGFVEPDVWVKGTEYSPEVRGSDIPEVEAMKATGGKVVYVDTGIDVHTRHLIKRMNIIEMQMAGSR
jgi:D-beta-D-heptose 7-phosphate kinase/D-beta-D-heptose 1-phosphate adenosyltransferase